MSFLNIVLQTCCFIVLILFAGALMMESIQLISPG